MYPLGAYISGYTSGYSRVCPFCTRSRRSLGSRYGLQRPVTLPRQGLLLKRLFPFPRFSGPFAPRSLRVPIDAARRFFLTRRRCVDEGSRTEDSSSLFLVKVPVLRCLDTDASVTRSLRFRTS